VSNLDPWDLREAEASLTREAIACDQVLYNLLERTPEAHELPWTDTHGAAFVAYTPLGGLPEHVAALQRIGDRHGVTASTVVLAFLLRHPNAFVIPKAATIAHVEANARASDLELSEEEIAAIDAISPMRERSGPLPTN
jgi:diketogulonate reductase-like aldo/keto reductase